MALLSLLKILCLSRQATLNKWPSIGSLKYIRYRKLSGVRDDADIIMLLLSELQLFYRRTKKRNANVVEWTDPAKQDLKSIHDYISRDSRLYAKKVSFELIEKTE